jgi:pimeloyl-ACP methyl ester carboxylesterase
MHATGAPPATTLASGCWPRCPSRSDGSNWPACRLSCSKAVTARRSFSCTAGSSAAGRTGRPWSPASLSITASWSPTFRVWGSRSRWTGWTADTFADWFAALLRLTCEEQPTLIAHSLLGSFAARFGARHSELLRRLVIYAAPGIGPYRMPLGLMAVAIRFGLRPTERNSERFDDWAFFDLDRTRRQDPEWFDAFSAYTLSRARVPHVKRTMRQLIATGKKRVPDADLRRIEIPAALLWGSHDRFVSLGLGEGASTRLGWPLHVVDDAGHAPHIERPDAFLDALPRERVRGFS